MFKYNPTETVSTRAHSSPTLHPTHVPPIATPPHPTHPPPPQLTLQQRIDHHKSLLRTEMLATIHKLRDDLAKTKETLKSAKAHTREQALVIADLSGKYEALKPLPEKLAGLEREFASAASSLVETRERLEHWTAVAKQRETEIQVGFYLLIN